MSTVSSTGVRPLSSVPTGMIPSRLPSMSIVGVPSAVPASWPSVVSTTMSTFAVSRVTATLAGSSTVTPTLLMTSSISTCPTRSDTVPSASLTAPVIRSMVAESSSSVLAGRPFSPSSPPSCCRSTEMTPDFRSIDTRPFSSVSGSSSRDELAPASASSTPVTATVPPPALTEATPTSRSSSASRATLPSSPFSPTAASSVSPTPARASLRPVESPPTAGELIASVPSARTYSDSTSPASAVAVEPSAPSPSASSSTISSLTPSTPTCARSVVRSTLALP